MERAAMRAAKAQACFERATALMAEHNVMPTPTHYEIWYNYVSDDMPHLTRAIDAWIDRGEPFTDAVAMDLWSRFFNAPAEASHLHVIGDRLSAEIEKISGTIEATGRDTSTYNQTLTGVVGILGSTGDVKSIGTVIENIIAATRQMERKSRELETKLMDSTTEVRSLREDIDAIRRQSLTDQLTGIANRKCFDERLREAMLEAVETDSPLCLLMGDVDHFKRFNDTWGHQTGDQVLRLVARALTENVKGRDTPARYGGEEFAVILPNTTLEDAAGLADSIRRAVEVKKVIKRSTGETLGAITMSLGVACVEQNDSPVSLIDRADAALYEAKKNGRNCIRVRTGGREDASDAA